MERCIEYLRIILITPRIERKLHTIINYTLFSETPRCALTKIGSFTQHPIPSTYIISPFTIVSTCGRYITYKLYSMNTIYYTPSHNEY